MGQSVWLFTPVVRRGFGKKSMPYWSGPWTVVKELNPLTYLLMPSPLWAGQKKNTRVSIDKMKPFVCHPAYAEEDLSHPPPAGYDLSTTGNEFMELTDIKEDDVLLGTKPETLRAY